MGDFFLQTASLISLLFLGSGTYYIAKKLHLPLSASLVAAGIIIAIISSVEIFSFLDDFRLTNEILFYALLPVLIFESAYNMKYRELIENRYSISSLSIISLLISAFVISGLLYYGGKLIGFEIPYIVALLFGSLISATDTAAALGTFKNIGVPKRLVTLFEGESLFNDGTAIALFLVVLEILQSYSTSPDYSEFNSLFDRFLMSSESFFGSFFPLVDGFFTLSLMIGLGILFGIFIGIIFSKIIEKIENETYLEVVLTLTLAHATFLLAEAVNYYIIPVSGIIATVASAMFIGNYGRYKISPKVEPLMQNYWGFFSFISNILIFILVGIMLIKLQVHWKPIISLIFLSIPAVIFARFISVYPIFSFLNFLKKEPSIKKSWQFVLSWGALRGVMALMMVLLIPKKMEISSWTHYPMTIQETLLALTIGVVAFSVFVQSLSLPFLIRKLGLSNLNLMEKLQFRFQKMILLENSLQKIQVILDERYIDQEEGKYLKSKYLEKIIETKISINELKDKEEFHHALIRVFALHALNQQDRYLKRMYEKQEIDEKTFKNIHRQIQAGITEIEAGETKIQNTQNIKIQKNRLERFSEYILEKIDRKTEIIEKKYYENRSFHVIFERTLENLRMLQKNTSLGEYSELQEIIEKYQSFYKNAEDKRRTLFAHNREKLRKLSGKLTKNALHITEEEMIENNVDQNVIHARLGNRLKQQMNDFSKNLN